MPELTLLAAITAAFQNAGFANPFGTGELQESIEYPNVIVVDHEETPDTDSYNLTDNTPTWEVGKFTVECRAETVAAVETLAKTVRQILLPASVTAGVGIGQGQCRVFRTKYSVGVEVDRSKANRVIAVARIEYKAVGIGMDY